MGLCTSLLLLGSAPVHAAGKLYHHVNDPHEWTNLAGNPEFASRLEDFRRQLAERLPDPTEAPAPVKTDAEIWKDTFFERHPKADADGDGKLTWPEYKAYRAQLDAKKKKESPSPS